MEARCNVRSHVAMWQHRLFYGLWISVGAWWDTCACAGMRTCTCCMHTAYIGMVIYLSCQSCKNSLHSWCCYVVAARVPKFTRWKTSKRPLTGHDRSEACRAHTHTHTTFSTPGITEAACDVFKTGSSAKSSAGASLTTCLVPAQALSKFQVSMWLWPKKTIKAEFLLPMEAHSSIRRTSSAFRHSTGLLSRKVVEGGLMCISAAAGAPFRISYGSCGVRYSHLLCALRTIGLGT